MTKEEVRNYRARSSGWRRQAHLWMSGLALAVLHWKPLFAIELQVTAVKNPAALTLIETNRQRLGRQNVEVIAAEAPCALTNK